MLQTRVKMIFMTKIILNIINAIFKPLFSTVFERNMSDAVEEHDRKVSMGGTIIINLWFDNDIDVLAGIRAGTRNPS